MSNTLNVSNPIVLARLSSDPVQAEEGEIYYNTTLDCFRQYANEAWSNLGAPLSKNDVGLSNVDNTSDANKPVSTAQKAAIDNAYYFAIAL